MRPKLCKPSHEAHQISSFKTHLPNLTAFKKSSRRWITGFVFKYSSWKICGPKYVSLRWSPPNNFVQNVPPKSDGLQKIQPTLDHSFRFQGLILKICSPNYVSLRWSPSNKFVQNVLPKSDDLQKNQPTLDHRFCFQGLILKICGPKYVSLRMKPAR